MRKRVRKEKGVEARRTEKGGRRVRGQEGGEVGRGGGGGSWQFITFFGFQLLQHPRLLALLLWAARLHILVRFPAKE